MPRPKSLMSGSVAWRSAWMLWTTSGLPRTRSRALGERHLMPMVSWPPTKSSSHGLIRGQPSREIVPSRTSWSRSNRSCAGLPMSGQASTNSSHRTALASSILAPTHDRIAPHRHVRPLMSQAPPTEPLHRVLGLTDDEYERVLNTLGREPNRAELAMYSVMWSEHCSYKSSKVHLRGLPTEGPQVLQGPGENAGVVDIGDGLAAVFKIESHNHPSFVEPFQGAATGVGGIIRDILAMGARPVASLNSLRFGELAEPPQRRLLEGVVAGVGHYGNCVGVATVGGEVVFDPCYAGNPLVNALTLGIVPAERLLLGRAERPGDLAVLLGAKTGRDGIGGASVLASASFADGDQAKRPNVQVGDPFQEKLLIESCLELVERGLLAGLQDLGAAGVSCAVSEVAARAGMGMDF